MITEPEALEKILARVKALGAEQVPLLAASGRFAATDLRARMASPLFDNSSMDGYAVRASEARPGARLGIGGEQPAGPDRGFILGPGEAIRIFTGAPLPRGADAVVMQEAVAIEGNSILLSEEVAPGENIRTRGGDVGEGQKILGRGERITPQIAALLASQGWAEVAVSCKPRVAILSTGDELLPPGAPLAQGEIYESNSVLLAALVAGAGAEPVLLGIAPDAPGPLGEKLAAGLEQDVLLVSGGVSVGERDFVKTELRALGVTLDVWRVAIKPGKPFAFGCRGGCAVFGLPGNPVSSFVTFLQFVRPALLQMAGARLCSLPALPAVAGVELSNPGDRPHYLRGRLADGKFAPFGRQESHALFGLSRSNALVRLAPGEKVAAGSMVSVQVWDWPNDEIRMTNDERMTKPE